MRLLPDAPEALAHGELLHVNPVAITADKTNVIDLVLLRERGPRLDCDRVAVLAEYLVRLRVHLAFEVDRDSGFRVGDLHLAEQRPQLGVLLVGERPRLPEFGHRRVGVRLPGAGGPGIARPRFTEMHRRPKHRHDDQDKAADAGADEERVPSAARTLAPAFRSDGGLTWRSGCHGRVASAWAPGSRLSGI